MRKPKDVPIFHSMGEADPDSDFIIPLGLDPRVYNVLTHAVALNSTANLRPPKDGSRKPPLPFAEGFNLAGYSVDCCAAERI